ncbi:mechanosensitive ion channel protein MscS [Oceanimonas doudoroffii]|uniref:Mechanosensitive ion channel protein MscS n=1 Tax=Oceanimonas doudoroffii TaxID=84158 RepID=A0A233RH72_9GAMM|nr:mechanosensitive ion channel protein MscS [Oceanimonas doudoroffii]
MVTLPTRRLLPLLWLLFALPLGLAQAQSQTTDTPPYSALADLLENEQSRDALVNELRNLAQGTPAEANAAASAAAEPSASRELAQSTRAIAEGLGDQFTVLADVLNNLAEGRLTGDNGQFSMSGLLDASLNLGLVIAATLAAFLLLRRLAGPLFSRLDHWSRHGAGNTPVLRLVLCVALAAALDVLAVGLAYVGGNLVATFAVGVTGEQSTQASLFLNAFMVIELLKAGLRMLFSSRYNGLRLLPIHATEAAYWNRWLALLISLLGYGVMVMEPLVAIHVSPALSQGLNTLLMLAAFGYAVAVILKNRRRLSAALRDRANQSSLTASKLSLQLLARTWHWLALGYFTVVLVLVLLSPSNALPFVLFATLKTLGVIGVGALLSALLGQIIGRRIRLSDDLRRKLPLLEARLNSYIPNGLRFVRLLLLTAVILLSLNAWQVLDLATWYASDAGGVLMGRIVSVAFILAMAAAIWVGLASLIEHKLNPETGTGMPSARTQTLLSLFRSALAVLLVTMTVMIALSELGIDIGPLIAGAGVLGLAIGFGAQKLVQDVITGVFIQIENAMNTGDVVTLGGITGTAEKLSIRSVGIRDLSGTYHIIPFSSVDTVSNYMRDFAYHVGEYRVAYRENIDEAIAHLQHAFEELVADPEQKPYVLEALEVAGVIALADSSVNIRVRIMTAPGMQWAVGRAYNRLVKMHFEQAGIEIPYPQSTVHFEGSRQGEAPALKLERATSSARHTGTCG